MRLVDPDLLDGRIVQVGLEWTVARDPGHQIFDDLLRVVDRPDRTGQTALFMRVYSGSSEVPHRIDVGERVHAMPPNFTADVGIEEFQCPSAAGRTVPTHRPLPSRASSPSYHQFTGVCTIDAPIR
jgi:hypothetical protein